MFRKLTKLLLILGILFTGTLVSAHKVQAAGASFSVSRVANKNQNDTSVSYFDLKLKPAQVTKVQVKVTNLSNKTLHLIASPNTGYTTDGGAVAYDLQNPGKKSTAPAQLQKIMGGQQKVTVAPKGQRIVSFTVKMPTTTFKGVLDGAIYFLDTKTSSPTATNKKNFTISNRYAMALGMTLHEDTQTIIAPSLALGKIDTGMDNADEFSPAFKVNIINNHAALAKKLHITSQISKHGNVLFKTNTANLTMAADSNFNYAITTNHTALKAGTYHLHLVAKSGVKKWTFNRTFTITNAQAKKANKHAHIKKSYLIWYILAAILLLLLLIFAFWLGKRSSKSKK